MKLSLQDDERPLASTEVDTWLSKTCIKRLAKNSGVSASQLATDEALSVDEAVLGLADPRARERAARVALGPLGRAGAGRLA